MALPTGPPAATMVTSTTVLASDLWNTAGPAALDAWMRNPPHAVLAQSVAQSIPDSLTAPIALDQVIRDNYSGAHPTNYTAQVPGTYLVQAVTNLAWTGASGKVVGSYLTVNAQAVAAIEVPASPAPVRFQHSISALIRMNVGDYVELRIFHDAGAAQPTGFTGCPCRMSARWIAL